MPGDAADDLREMEEDDAFQVELHKIGRCWGYMECPICTEKAIRNLERQQGLDNEFGGSLDAWERDDEF